MQETIEDAIINPEKYASRMLPTETMSEWQARAVVYALRSVGTLGRPRAIQQQLYSVVMICERCSPREPINAPYALTRPSFPAWCGR